MFNHKKRQIKIERIKNLKEHVDKEVGGFFGGLVSFLKEYAVIGMAIGVIIAQASKDLVDSIVKGLFLPLIQLFISKDNFNGLAFYIKGIKFDIGGILGNFTTFLIIMIFLYFLVKKIIKSDKLLEKFNKPQ